MRLVKILFVIFAFFISTSLFCQPVIHLVKDIALGSNGSDPQLFTASSNQLFFAAANQSEKVFNKLWKSDGTEQGTVQVTPSSNIYVIQQAAIVNNFLFYWANATPAGGLYKTDGTEAGTQLLLSNNYTPESYYYAINNLFSFNGKLFFVASHNKLGDEPSISDGTPSGTFLLKDIASGENVSSNLSGITQVGSLLYFTAFNELGRELWCTDGTSDGTRLVTDLNPGPASSMQYGSSHSVAYKDTLFFAASTTYGDYSSLYKTAGTSASTGLVKSFTYGILPGSLYVHNSFLYFFANTDNTGYKLWKSDGTAAGTVQLINQGSSYSIPQFITINNWLYFLYSTPTAGTELWRTDGTAANTMMVKDISTGNADAFEGTMNLMNVNGTLFFMANDGTHGKELWKSDGTAEGTQLVKDINAGSGNAVFDKPIVFQNQLYFVSNDVDDLTRQECWRSDGTSAGTIMIKNIDSALGLFDVRPEIVFQNKLYLSAKDSDSGSEIWRTDGNMVSQLKEVNTTPADADPNKDRWGLLSPRFVGLNNTLFFSADNVRYGRELWMTKGTEATTRLVKDFTKVPTTLWYNSTNTDSYFNGMIVYKNQLFVLVNGNQLWKIDEEGTTQLLLQNSDISSTYLGNFTIFKDELYFRFGLYGSQVYRTDGTVCTPIILSIPGTFLFAHNNFLFLWGYNGSQSELWKIDGQSAVPQKVKGLNGSVENDSFGIVGNLVFFTTVYRVNQSYHKYQLWRTDGTEEGTFLLTDTNGNGDDGVTGKILNFNNKAYYSLNNGSGQIWSTDGTIQGTKLTIALDVPPGRLRYFDLFDIVNGQLVFHSWIPNVPVPQPIYRSDGTQNGSVAISNDNFLNMYSGFTHNQKHYFSPPSSFVLWETDATPNSIRSITDRSISGTFQYEGSKCAQSHNGKFYFVASSPQYGTELFVQEAEILPSVAIKDNPERGQSIKYQATGAITATNQPTSYSANNYQSNTSVTLAPGFETQSYTAFTAEITTPALSQVSTPKPDKALSLVLNDVVVPTISRYEIEPALSKIQNSVIYRMFKYPDASKPMPTTGVSKEKLSTGQTRYTFVVISEGKMLQESVDVF